MVIAVKIISLLFFTTVAVYTLVAVGKYLFGKRTYYSDDEDWDNLEKFLILMPLWFISFIFIIISVTC